jgi:hypothetical protein|tara:strand:- start:68 stop:901 length:834 start_codon:yes stop_codon:yes gene_type:complete
MSNNIYYNIYSTLCQSHKHNKELYKKGSGLHKHHIVPIHNGGDDTEDNHTYLTVREHSIAHFLLWKLYKLPNDLRAMKMLGVKLTPEQRKITGEFCRDNKIGFHNPKWNKFRIEWTLKGFESQRKSKSKQSFYYWYTPEGRKERASMGGKASFLSDNNKEFKFWASPEGRKERASMGGKAHKGKKCMYIPGEKTFKRVTVENIQEYLNKGYIFGSPLKPTKDRKFGASPLRKKVTDGKEIFESMSEASEKYNKTPSAITYYCKSKNHPNWNYILSEL